MKGNANSFIHKMFYLLTVPAIIYVISIIFRLDENTKFTLDSYGSKLIDLMSTAPILKIFEIITFLGSKWGIITLLLGTLIWLWWVKKDYFGMLVLFLSVVIGNELNKWIKDFYQRERPLIDPAIDAEGYSFPSGHAMVGIIFYGLLSYFIIREIKNYRTKILIIVSMSILVFLIGLSRIILQAHYPTDVFGGFSIGFCFLALSVFVIENRVTVTTRYLSKGQDVN